MKKYDEASVIASLSKKASIRINSVQKTIDVVRDSADVGNGSWGKIDYLCKVHGFHYVFVKSIGAKKKKDTDNVKEKKTKAAKREDKLNMAAMAKNAMKKAKNK